MASFLEEGILLASHDQDDDQDNDDDYGDEDHDDQKEFGHPCEIMMSNIHQHIAIAILCTWCVNFFLTLGIFIRLSESKKLYIKWSRCI